MTKKFLTCFVILSIIFTSMNLRADKKEKFLDESIASIINELERIREGGITEEEIHHFIEFLQEKFEGGVYVNMMCKVTGFGMGLLLPPFIPVSPVLIAVLGLLLDTDGLMGHWAHVVHIAVFIPFVGLPAYFIPPAFFFIAGFAGIVIGIAIFQ